MVSSDEKSVIFLNKFEAISDIQKIIHPSIHSLPSSTAEEVLFRFNLICLLYSECFEYQCSAVERIPALYSGSP